MEGEGGRKREGEEKKRGREEKERGEGRKGKELKGMQVSRVNHAVYVQGIPPKTTLMPHFPLTASPKLQHSNTNTTNWTSTWRSHEHVLHNNYVLRRRKRSRRERLTLQI